MKPTDRLTNPLVVLADTIAAEAHPEQFSPSSTIPHPRRVAWLLASLDGVDQVDVAAATLHEVLENSPVTAPALTNLLLAGGTNPDVTSQVVALVQELTKPYPSVSCLRPAEKRAKALEKLQRISDRAKRIKLADHLDTLINGEPMPSDKLSVYLAESETVVATCGHVDGPLAGWLLLEIDKRRNPGRKED